MMRFAAEAARYFGTAEIVEIHETSKKDAPSGTALRTARLMADAPGRSCRAGARRRRRRAASAPAGVRIHSVRLPGLVAHQEVVFGGGDEMLTIRHDSFSRDLLHGRRAARPARASTGLKGTVVGLENLLD